MSDTEPCKSPEDDGMHMTQQMGFEERMEHGMTQLLERLDKLEDRLGKIEQAQAAIWRRLDEGERRMSAQDANTEMALIAAAGALDARGESEAARKLRLLVERIDEERRVGLPPVRKIEHDAETPLPRRSSTPNPFGD